MVWNKAVWASNKFSKLIAHNSVLETLKLPDLPEIVIKRSATFQELKFKTIYIIGNAQSTWIDSNKPYRKHKN